MGAPSNAKLAQVRSIIERYLLEGGDPAAAMTLVDEHPEFSSVLRDELGKLALINVGIEDCRGDPTESEVARSLNRRIAIPGYELIERIGTGGQATVIRAKQTSTGQQVAIKAVHGGAFLSDSARERFDREIRILAELNHPYIVSILDRGTTDEGTPYVVMRYVAGDDLDDWLVARRASKDNKLDANEAQCLIELLTKICDAIEVAHAKGITHRDLKPSNVRIDLQESPRVLDFGLAQLQDAAAEMQVTRTGQFVGSLPWSSPEQLQGQRDLIDARSDTYALGLLLYEILAARLPYKLDGTLGAAIDALQNASPQPLTRCLASQPLVSGSSGSGWGHTRLRALDAVAMKAVAVDRDRRYESAGALADDLRAVLAGQVTKAALLTRRRFWPWVAAIAVAIVALYGIYSVVAPRTYEVHGRVWLDADRNTFIGPEETGIPGAIVFADLNGNGRRDPDEQNAITDADGRYAFSVSANEFSVRCDNPHQRLTFPHVTRADEGRPSVFWMGPSHTELCELELVPGELPDFTRPSRTIELAVEQSNKVIMSEVRWLGPQDLLVEWRRVEMRLFRRLRVDDSVNQVIVDGHVGSSWAVRDWGDVDGDGRTDLLYARDEGVPDGERNWDLGIAKGTPDGGFNFSDPPAGTILHQRHLSCHLLDVDGDERLDIIYQAIPWGGYFTTEVHAALGMPDGRFDFDHPLLLCQGPEDHGMHIGRPADLDGDGDKDMFLRAEDDVQDVGQCYVALNRGGATFEVQPTLDAHPDVETGGQDQPTVAGQLADLNSDGRLDVVVSSVESQSYPDRTGSATARVRLHLGLGNGQFDEQAIPLPDFPDREQFGWVYLAAAEKPAQTAGEPGVHHAHDANRGQSLDFGYAD